MKTEEVLALELKRFAGCPVDICYWEECPYPFRDSKCVARSKAVQCWNQWAKEKASEEERP